MEWIAKPFFEMPPRCPPVEEFYLTSPVWDEHMWDGPHDVEEGLHIRLSCLRRIHLSQADACYAWEELMLSRIAIPAECSNPMELLNCDEFETTSPTNRLPPAADSSPPRGIDSIFLQLSKQHCTSGFVSVHSRTLLVIPYATLNARGLRLAKKAGSCSYLVALVDGHLPVRHWKDMLSILPSLTRLDIVQLDNTRNGLDHACDVLCPEPYSRGPCPNLRMIYWHTTNEFSLDKFWKKARARAHCGCPDFDTLVSIEPIDAVRRVGWKMGQPIIQEGPKKKWGPSGWNKKLTIGLRAIIILL